MLAKMFAGAMEASLHRRDAGFERLSDLRMTTPFLHQGKQRAVLRSKLAERMTQGVEFLGIDRPGRLRNVFVLLAERKKNPAQLLPPQLIDTGVAREPEKPRLELGGSLQAIDGTDHLDEHLLGQIFDVIAPTGHGVNEACHPVLIADHKFPLGGLVALLSLPHKVGQGSR